MFFGNKKQTLEGYVAYYGVGRLKTQVLFLQNRLVKTIEVECD